MATQITLDFETDFVIRVAGALLAYSNSVLNVIIYMVQMKGFRAFLKKALTPRFVGKSESQPGLEIQEFKCQEQSRPSKVDMHLEMEHRL